MQSFMMLLQKMGNENETSPRELLCGELEYIAKRFNNDITLKEELKTFEEGRFIECEVLIKTSDDSLGILVDIKNGVFTISEPKETKVKGATVIFGSEKDIKEYMNADFEAETLKFLATDIVVEGNPAHFSLFNYLLSCLPEYLRTKEELIKKSKKQNEVFKFEIASKAGKPQRGMRNERLKNRSEEMLNTQNVDVGVKWIKKPYIPQYNLEDFPRLEKFRESYLNEIPSLSEEQGELLTDYYLENGYYINKNDKTPWNPFLRSAHAFHYLMTNKKPLIRENDLLAGTMTTDPMCGCIAQPYTVGWKLWGDLRTLENREDEPFKVSDRTLEVLHKKVFPFWIDKHVEAVWKTKVDEDSKFPGIIDRKSFTIPWGLLSLNPGCPGFGKVVKKGLKAIREEIKTKIEEFTANEKLSLQEKKNKIDSLTAMDLTLKGISNYTKNLANMIEQEIKETNDSTRISELESIKDILLKVPDNPTETVYEAIQVLWIMFIGVGLDSMNETMSIGRLDQILQPYFESDMSLLKDEKERENYLKDVLELVGCFFMRITSNRYATDTQFTWQHSGSPADTSIIIGGVTPDGDDAVNDMTYVILKVVEMLSTDDPDMDARYMTGVNSKTYLKRVCDVNYLTCGTPAIHNDKAIIDGWMKNNPDWDIRDMRDWVPCGCVEPVIAGKHFAAPADLDSNFTVALELALNNGRHPKWDNTVKDNKIGLETGEVESFEHFDDFFEAFEKQFKNYFSNAIKDVSFKIAEAQKEAMPAPLYSTLLEGCIEEGAGMLEGAVKYNTAASSLIGFSDVIDSLLSIKKIVFEDKKFNFNDLKAAVDSDFETEDGRKIYTAIRHSVNKFGSGEDEGVDMARRVTKMVGDFFHSKTNPRGGHYTSGYKTTSSHTAFGMVAGALPSGRRANMPFTPGLTPSPQATKNIMNNLLDVAALDSSTCENSFAFNVRLSFSKHNSYEQNIDLVTNYVETYCKNGGMQIQLNMVDTDTLIDAMANPEHYPDLIVRISGYTGFFTRMQRELQLEVVGRTEFAL